MFWTVIWNLVRSAGLAAAPYLLPYIVYLRKYLWAVTLGVGILGGWYFTANWYKLDNQAKMGAALASKNTQIDVLLARNEQLAKENAKIQTSYLLNRNPLCNTKLGVVRMLNIQLDPMYRPKDLHPDDAASTSKVTGGEVAEALGQCATQYNKVRNEIIRLHKEAERAR